MKYNINNIASRLYIISQFKNFRNNGYPTYNDINNLANKGFVQYFKKLSKDMRSHPSIDKKITIYKDKKIIQEMEYALNHEHNFNNNKRYGWRKRDSTSHQKTAKCKSIQQLLKKGYITSSSQNNKSLYQQLISIGVPMKKISSVHNHNIKYYTIGNDKNLDMSMIGRQVFTKEIRDKFWNALKPYPNHKNWRMCPLCHRPIKSEAYLNLDHRIPHIYLVIFNKNDKDFPNNIRACCVHCNEIKRTECNTNTYKKLVCNSLNYLHGFTPNNLKCDSTYTIHGKYDASTHFGKEYSKNYYKNPITPKQGRNEFKFTYKNFKISQKKSQSLITTEQQQLISLKKKYAKLRLQLFKPKSMNHNEHTFSENISHHSKKPSIEAKLHTSQTHTKNMTELMNMQNNQRRLD